MCDLPRGRIFREKGEARAELTLDTSLLQLANVLNKHCWHSSVKKKNKKKEAVGVAIE